MAGWAYQWVTQVSFVRDSWTAPVAVRRLPPGHNVHLLAAEQIRAVVCAQPPGAPPQHAAGRQTGPVGPIQDAMVALKAPGVFQTQHPPGRRDGPPPGSEERADDEHESVRPDAAAEQWRERRQG